MSNSIPNSTKADSVANWRTTMIDYLDTPSVKPYISISTTPRSTPQEVKPRIYSDMKIEDYPPYKELNLGPGLFGPMPYVPSECACGRLGRYEEEPFCMCAMSCRTNPKYALYKANPELYKAEQEELKVHHRRYLLWINQRTNVENSNWLKSKYIINQFERLRDKESPIGCWECEKYGYMYCRCECDNCGSKYCDSNCEQDCEYL